MTWSITSRIDPDRWFESVDSGMEFEADVETTSVLGRLADYGYPLTPTGPWQQGVTKPSELFGAAWNLIPAPEVEGDPPPYPDVPSEPGVIY